MVITIKLDHIDGTRKVALTMNIAPTNRGLCSPIIINIIVVTDI